MDRFRIRGGHEGAPAVPSLFNWRREKLPPPDASSSIANALGVDSSIVVAVISSRASAIKEEQSYHIIKTPSRRSPIDSGLGPPIGDLDLSTKVVGTHGARRRTRWKGRGHRLAASTPNLSRTPSRRSLVYLGLRPLIGDPDPSIEVAGVLCGYQRPRWRDRDHRLAAPTPPFLSIFLIGLK
ncbi:hypothetical protein CRG98_034391 [Punica granatum]|uniref:Uncharacterized protein n=1 Tax=Punica granatum TaxID=22663 RepID=A0A2I0IND1_PUNGR|nr:hypothetical protein CRG98_034391 [Punica granatum]